MSRLRRRAAVLVDRILKGTNRSDLPIERPAKFELIINAKTAEALGRKLRHRLILGADTLLE